jgi:transcriptional regulator with XRE-family HTH domain
MRKSITRPVVGCRITRHLLRLTQQNLSELSGVHPSEISRVESRKITSSTARVVGKIARALDISPEQVVRVIDGPEAEAYFDC